MNQIIHLDLGGVNVYLLKAKDSFVLIDTGGYTFNDRPINDRCDLLDEKLIENGCTPGKLKLIILTHGDIDHIANCKFLKEKYKTKSRHLSAFCVAPQVGLEPTTLRLTAACSTS